jgi:hypothetical protein
MCLMGARQLMPKIKKADWNHISEYSLATEVRVMIFCTLSWGMRVWCITMKGKWKANHLNHENLTGHLFTCDEDVQISMAKWFREHPKKFYTDMFKTCLSLVALYQLRGGLQGNLRYRNTLHSLSYILCFWFNLIPYVDVKIEIWRQYFWNATCTWSIAILEHECLVSFTNVYIWIRHTDRIT